MNRANATRTDLRASAEPPRRAKLADVARAAGVSASIASRVLNHDDVAVRPGTRERVIQAARELDYKPHAIARGLRQASTGILGLLMPDLTNLAFARMIRTAVQHASQRDFAVVVLEDRPGDDISETFARLLGTGRVDGVLVASARPRHPLFKSPSFAALPHVFVNRAVTGSGRNVTMDLSRDGTLALTELHRLGHRDVGLIAGPPAFSTSRDRVRGFVEAAAALKLNAAPICAGDLSEQGGAHAAAELLARNPELTAVCIGVFPQAIGALQVLWSAGVKIPEHLSVIVFDDLPMANYGRPPLTRLRIPIAELGVTAVDAVVEQVEGGAPRDVCIDIDPVLVPGASVDLPRSGRDLGFARETLQDWYHEAGP